MGVGDRLKNIGNYVRKRWRSTDPDSYYQYRRGRERKREQAEQRREDAERHGEQEREEAERGVSTKSAIELNAQPRSRERRHLAVTRAIRNDALRPV
jgi:hypothetical protein